MTTSQDLLALVYGALTATDATTDAGARVYQPGDWPTQQDQYPIIKLRLASENRTSAGRNTILFTTVTTVQIIGEVSCPAEAGNAGAAAAEAALWALKRQIEIAIVNSYPLTGEIQQFPSINTTLAFDASGSTHVASILVALSMEFPEGAENFAPIASHDLTKAHADVTTYPGVGADISLPAA